MLLPATIQHSKPPELTTMHRKRSRDVLPSKLHLLADAATEHLQHATDTNKQEGTTTTNADEVTEPIIAAGSQSNSNSVKPEMKQLQPMCMRDVTSLKNKRLLFKATYSADKGDHCAMLALNFDGKG